MIIDEINYFQFAGIPNPPLKTNKLSIEKRKGFIIQIKSAGNLSYGEASPLPGFSNESFEQVHRKLLQIKSSSTKLTSEMILKIVDDIPSLKFAFESALFQLELSKKKHLSNLSVRVNEMIGLNSIATVLSNIESAKRRLVHTIKIKIGGNDFKNDYELIETINKYYPEILLRLDVNGSWNYDEALNNLSHLSPFNIEYVEQPVKSLDELIKLSNETRINLAADECITSFNEAELLLKQTKINFIVVKPSMIGFKNTIDIINLASDVNKFVIISSLFESNVGKSALIYLTSLCKLDTAHGLSPEVSISNISINDSEILQQNGKVFLSKFPFHQIEIRELRFDN